MNVIARTAASALVALAAGQVSAARISDLKVVKDNLKAGMWSMRIEPYRVKGRYVSPPPSSGCATVQQLLAQLALPLSYDTHTKQETEEAPTIITKNLADHGTVEVTVPAVPGLASSRPTRRTLDVKKINKDNFVLIAGPGKLTTVHARYLGKCTP